MEVPLGERVEVGREVCMYLYTTVMLDERSTRSTR
jgi:hypothetical protein